MNIDLIAVSIVIVFLMVYFVFITYFVANIICIRIEAGNVITLFLSEGGLLLCVSFSLQLARL
ncbi:hypothetical protein SAMN04488589_2896 [Methanolobus vulcani]|jgi:hypothetical protein|uniref:Uncharacterized protein n=1 Tax=Methanolobus vulcani TaxID=38026 RepID=A0A7Z7FDS8_9EURY|nr:hypothetical protein SAMN04488589_2896 [Methanolobus vulcani]